MLQHAPCGGRVKRGWGYLVIDFDLLGIDADFLDQQPQYTDFCGEVVGLNAGVDRLGEDFEVRAGGVGGGAGDFLVLVFLDFRALGLDALAKFDAARFELLLGDGAFGERIDDSREPLFLAAQEIGGEVGCFGLLGRGVEPFLELPA